MRCPNCGRELADQVTICPYCGADSGTESHNAQKAGRYCTCCGQELHDSAVFCPKCGAKNETSGMASSPSSGTSQPPPAAQTAKTSQKSIGQKKCLVKLLLIIGMVCFIFPFATVSCADVSATVSGLEAMTSLTTQDSFNAYISEENPNLFLIFAFAFGIAAIWKMRTKSVMRSAITATFGALCLLAFRMSFVSYYGLSDYINVITLKFRWGWILSFLTYTAAAVLAWRYYLQEKNVAKPTTSITKSSSQAAPSQEAPETPPYDSEMPDEKEEE